MRVRVLSTAIGRGLAALALVLLVASRPARADDGLVLIRNAKNPTASLSVAAAAKLFTGRTKVWSDGSVVQPVLLDGGSKEFKWLAGRVFGIAPRELLSKMKQEVFRGEMRRPIVVSASADCAAAVARKAGAIGVVDAATAKALPAGVAIIKLDH